MKKILFFLITIATIMAASTFNVKADATNFYEGEYIDGIYMNKQDSGSNTIFYQKARFFRQSGTNKAAYCIEPFATFEESSNYQSTITPANLSTYQKDRISKLAHFGYGYGNRTESKWYAITQMMIWQAANPNASFYFTDSLNGNKINAFESEMSEINNTINNFDTIPSMANKDYYIVEGEKLELTDSNNVINKYQINNNLFKISQNKIEAENLLEGDYDIELTRTDNFHNSPAIFYQSGNSQDLVTMGNTTQKVYHLKIHVLKTSIELTKKDKDTNSTTPSGDASLVGAEYQIYDENMKEIDTITIEDDSKGIYNNLPLGKYYLKEIKPGTGYTLDTNTYDFTISKEDQHIKLELTNKVIEANITINKTYGENKYIPEQNASFEIYNKNQLIKTVITDSNGLATFTLPYGKYSVKQITGIDGYHKAEDFDINIDSDKEQIIELTDLKIKVPNTHTDNNLLKIVTIIILLCLKIFL